jgi:hypothetical protein
MKRFLIIFTLLLTATTLRAQQTESNDCESVIYLDSSKENSISSSNGKLSLMLNGTRFEIGDKEEQKADSTCYYKRGADGSLRMLSREELAIAAYNANIKTIESNKNKSKAYFGLFGIGAPRFNHFSVVEIGSNIFTGLSYDGYTKEEANALTFSSRKAVCVTMNVGSLNVPLTTNRSLVASLAFGFTWENYTIAGNYTMEYREGMMRPLAVDANLKKSKMVASYFHVPLTLDWNIKDEFFISAGVNLDILMGSHLKYKLPKTKIKDEITLNPVQAGFTARIGWKRIYVFANYTFNEAFKTGTGPKANRFSVGMGVGF